MARHDYRWLIEPWRGGLPYTCLALFVFVKITAWLGWSFLFVHSYLNDLICIPVFIAAAISLERLISGNRSLRYGKARIIFFTLFVGVVYEFLLTLRSPEYVADYYDLLCYGLSGLLTFGFSPCIDRNK